MLNWYFALVNRNKWNGLLFEIIENKQNVVGSDQIKKNHYFYSAYTFVTYDASLVGTYENKLQNSL